MNKTALKNFAIAARLDLLQRVMNRANLYGVNEETCKSRSFAPSSGFQKLGGALLTREEELQRNALIRRVNQQGYQQTMEEAAYTWFNRFVALRYMQEHQLLPVSQRVLPEAPGQMPEMIREAHQVALDGVDAALVLDMLDRNETTLLYRYLLISLCNALHDPLPQMFEKISDYTELLFPDGLLRDDSVLAALSKIPAEDFQDIQVIGWLYQYYNTELKNETFELLKKNVKITKERIGAATQLFTPEWIVRYMVQNSLGRLWLEGHPEENLRMKWRYYMDEAQQEPEVAAKLAEIRQGYASMQLEDIKLLDPCMGSGHILVYAFDLLMEIYRTMGYTDRDAVRSIVENNLYGLDIDDRAAQLAYFAVMMKACEYDRRFLRRGIQPHVCAMQESYGMPEEAWAYFAGQKNTAQALYRAFEHAKDFGSLIAPDATPTDLTLLESQMEEMARHAEYADLAIQATIASAMSAMQPLMEQARILVQRYDVVVTNPPYMTLGNASQQLNEYAKQHYPEAKADMFSIFILRCLQLCVKNGYHASVTMQSWMFLSSFEDFRNLVLQNTITSLVQIGYNSFPELNSKVAQAVTFVMQKNSLPEFLAKCLDLNSTYPQNHDKEHAFFDALHKDKYYLSPKRKYQCIPGSPIAYWISNKISNIFSTTSAISEFAKVSEGIKTGDNERYLRYWHEVDCKDFSFGRASSGYTWYPHHKGGEFHKWYGNLEWVINWKNNGFEIKASKNSGLQGQDMYFKTVCGSTKVSSRPTTMRLYQQNVLFDSGAPSIMAGEMTMYIMSLINSNVGTYVLNLLNPTLGLQVGDIKKIPIVLHDKEKVDTITAANVDMSRIDWDSFETSWDFKKHPLI